LARFFLNLNLKPGAFRELPGPFGCQPLHFLPEGFVVFFCVFVETADLNRAVIISRRRI
jgi:hypothetical protein